MEDFFIFILTRILGIVVCGLSLMLPLLVLDAIWWTLTGHNLFRSDCDDDDDD